MIFYKYDENTFKFNGTVKGQINPIKKGYLQPANTTTKQPPENYSINEVPIFSIDLNEWVLVDSEYKKEMDAVKLEEVNEWGVKLYEINLEGKIVNRSEVEITAETQEAIDNNNQRIREEKLNILKEIMDDNIINKAKEVTKATTMQSAQAFIQAFTLRMNKPAEYVNDGLKVFYPIDTYNLYDSLDTEAKITDYYKKVLIFLDKFRESEIANYLTKKSLL